MRALMIFTVLCLHLTMDGQSITHVRYWFDQNDSESIIESTDGNPWQDAVDVSALSEGWHFIHYAFKDNLGQWSAVETDRFRKRISTSNELASVTYWFNADDSAPVNVPLSDPGWNSSIDVSALPLGWHFIHFYFHDIRGQKSSASRARFLKRDDSQTLITTAELWFDTDDSSPVQVTAIGENVTFNNNFSTAGLDPGWHDVHLRFIDNKGRASSVISSRARVNDGAENKVLLARFWFDDCDADDQLVYEYQSPSPELVFFTCTCLAPCNPVVGDHQMNVQFQDTRGVWSSVVTETLFFNDTPCDTDCRADINGDGIVDIQDFIELNSAFGTSCVDCPEDINDDGNVDIQDFITLNSSYGKVCAYAFEGQEPIAPPITKELKEELALHPEVTIHEEIQKVLFNESAALANIYPNPSNGQEIYVRLSGLENSASLTNLRVLDAQGKVVLHKAYQVNGSEALLQVAFDGPLASGHYIIDISTTQGRIASEFLVE